MKVLLDTNVIVDLFLRRASFKDVSRIWNANKANLLSACVVASSVTDIFYITNRYGVKGDARYAIQQTLQHCTILDTNRAILILGESGNGIDFEDDVQIASAIMHKMNFIVTSDRKGFRQSPVAVVSPADFVVNHL